MKTVPKQKPLMDAPKESGRQRGVVKDARDLLTQHYTTQAASRQPGGRSEGESPTDYATNKLEGAERDVLHTGKQTAGRAVKEYQERTKAAKVRRQHEAEGGAQTENAAAADTGQPAAPDRATALTVEGSAQPGAARESGDNPSAAQAKPGCQQPYH